MVYKNKHCKNEVRIIKKYQNRRLYDTATSTYVILEDIKQMIVDGERVQVIDAKTAEDVTRAVLLQIILDEEVGKVSIFSNDFLFQIIKFYGKSFNASVSPFLEQGLELFKKMQRGFYEQMRDLYGKSSLPMGVELWQDFIAKQTPLIEGMIKDQVESNTNVFLKMQEQLQEQASKLYDCMEFPFTYNKDNKKPSK